MIGQFLRAFRLGFALARLERAKCCRGFDWVLHSSWCSDQEVFVAITRNTRCEKALGTPVCGDLESVLRQAADAARGNARYHSVGSEGRSHLRESGSPSAMSVLPRHDTEACELPGHRFDAKADQRQDQGF